MAIDYLTIKKNPRPKMGEQAIIAANALIDVRDRIQALEASAQRMVDGGDVATLETNFGLNAGAGANFISLLGSTKTAIEAAILQEFTARLANQ